MNPDLPCGYVCKDINGTLSIACRCCKLKFNQLCELRAHISKTILEVLEVPDLPDKCLMKIFGFLTPNQLVNVSRVSRKFKFLAEKVFESYFDPGPIQIKFDIPHDKSDDDESEENRSAQWNFVCRSQYETVFPSSIRRLMIPSMSSDVTGGGYDKLFQFIRENCSKELMSLVFYDNHSIISDDCKDRCRLYGEIAKDQLKHLKYLRVKNVQFEYLYDELLRYTEHLRTLTVITTCLIDCHYGFSWTKHRYPELETISFYTANNRFDLMPIIRRNPKLRNVVCNSTATVRSICHSDIEFNFIGMIFSWCPDFNYKEFQRLYNDIVKFGRCKKFAKFELCLEEHCDMEVLRLVKNIPNLTGLHANDSIAGCQGHVSIQKLCVNYQGDDEGLVQNIDEAFPNLKELRINARRVPWNSPAFGPSFFKRFAHYVLCDDPDAFKNLKQLHYENDDDVELKWDDVVDINFIRSKRPNPSKILVYLDPVHFHKLNRNVVKLEFIEIKPWVYGGCELCVKWDSGI